MTDETDQDSHTEYRGAGEAKDLLPGRDGKDIICGSGLLILGIATAVYVYIGLPLGTYFQIGSGFLPLVMAVMIAVFGGLLLLPALFRKGETPKVEWRPMFTILGSVLAFGLAIERLGLIPAIFAMTIVATFADNKLVLGHRFILAASLSFIAVVIFYFGLDVRLNLLTWNW